MARDLAKDGAQCFSLGLAALGSLLDGAAQVSIHCWVQIDSVDNNLNDNRAVSASITEASSGLLIAVDNNSGSLLGRLGARSVTGDSFVAISGAAAIPLSTWVSLGGMVDFAAKTMSIYLNGVLDVGPTPVVGLTNSAFTMGAPTTTFDVIGGPLNGGGTTPPPSTQQFDGRIAEVALWRTDIAAAAFKALAIGEQAPRVRASSLAFYMPIYGAGTRDIELGRRAFADVTAGSVPAAPHPPMVNHGYQKWRDQGRRFLG